MTGLRPHPDAARHWPPVTGRIRGRLIRPARGRGPGKHVTLAAGQTRGRVPGFPGRRYRIPAELREMNQENLLSVLVKIGSIGACRARGQDTWLSGPAAG